MSNDSSWKPYPSTDVYLEGDVTGPVHIVGRGDGSVGVYTENGGRLTYRGQEYTTHLEFVATPEGVTLRETWEDGRQVAHNSVYRGILEEAPKTYRARIVAAVAEAVAGVWSVDFDRAGLEATVAQNVHRLERDLSEALEAAKVARAAIRRERRRLG